jgi:hypothetical protein
MIVTGCAGGGPSVVLAVPGGTMPLHTPAPVMPGGGIGAPPGLEPAATPVVTTGERSGSYAGTAQPLDTGGGLCISTQRVTNFHVRGNAVQFGGFRGTIAADGGLQMVYGSQWIIGQFEGATFHGEMEISSRFGNPGCSFLLTLQRVGP